MMPSEVVSTSLLQGKAPVSTQRGGSIRWRHEPELARRQELAGPRLEVLEGDVEAGRDDGALVEAAVQVDDDLAGAVVVDDLKLANVAVLHHAREELDDDLARGADQDLRRGESVSTRQAYLTHGAPGPT